MSTRKSDAARLAGVACALSKRGVPNELVPPLSALVEAARAARPDDADTPWRDYAKAADSTISGVAILLNWLDDDAESLRARDACAFKCVVEDADGNVSQVGDDASQRRKVIAALRRASDALRMIDVDVLKATRAMRVWNLLGSWGPKLQASEVPPGHVVAFIANAIALAHGYASQSTRDGRAAREIAAMTQAVFQRDERDAEARSMAAVSTALSEIRAVLGRSGWQDAPEQRVRLGRRYWKRAARLRKEHGEAVFGTWPDAVAERWLHGG